MQMEHLKIIGRPFLALHISLMEVLFHGIPISKNLSHFQLPKLNMSQPHMLQRKASGYANSLANCSATLTPQPPSIATTKPHLHLLQMITSMHAPNISTSDTTSFRRQ